MYIYIYIYIRVYMGTASYCVLVQTLAAISVKSVKRSLFCKGIYREPFFSHLRMMKKCQVWSHLLAMVTAVLGNSSLIAFRIAI